MRRTVLAVAALIVFSALTLRSQQQLPATSGTFTAAGDLSGTSSSQTVIGINGTNMAALGTGVLYNTTGTGVPSIASAANILAACTGCAPLISPSFTTPALGAATATSLLASGIVDGQAPITVTTGTTATLGAGTYKSGYTYNQEGTAGTGVTYTLPATATGLQYCVQNSIVSGSGAPDTGVLTVYPPSSSYVILAGVINTIGGGGTHGVASGGAAADMACFVAIDSTHWNVVPVIGTWAEN